MQLLKQSTAQTYRMGPFVDATDGDSAETGLTIAQADIQISKAGGAFAQTSASSPTTTHDADGWYQLPLTATDTNTLGLLTVKVRKSGALPVYRHFQVVPAAVYDALIAGTDTLAADVTQWNGSNVATPASAGHPVVTAKVGTGTGEINLVSGAVPIRSVLKKNQALSGFVFLMTDSTNHNPAPALTVSATRSLDGGTFGAGTLGSVTEIANGFYKIDLPAADLNGNTVALRFTATGADDLPVTLLMEP